MGFPRGGRDAPVHVGVFAEARVKTRRLLPRSASASTDRSRRKKLERAKRVQGWEASLVVEFGRRRRRGPVPIERVAVLRRQQPVLASLLARDAVALARDAPPSVADCPRHPVPLAPGAVLVGPLGLGDRLDARARDAPRLGGVLEVRRVAVGTAGSAVAVRVAAAGVPTPPDWERRESPLFAGFVVWVRASGPRPAPLGGSSARVMARSIRRNSSRISPPPPRNMADETSGRPHAAKLLEECVSQVASAPVPSRGSAAAGPASIPPRPHPSARR